MTGLKYPEVLSVTIGSSGAKKFGELVVKHRKRKNWHQDLVAEKVGCSVSMISMIETGNRAASKDLADKIVKSLIGKLYSRFGTAADPFDIQIMDPTDECWRFFKFDIESRKDAKNEFEAKFDSLNFHEKCKVVGYMDALIESRGE